MIFTFLLSRFDHNLGFPMQATSEKLPTAYQKEKKGRIGSGSWMHGPPPHAGVKLVTSQADTGNNPILAEGSMFPIWMKLLPLNLLMKEFGN